MKIEKASTEAIKFACLYYHYAKAVPQVRLGYSVFNDSDEWCGVILFSNGANQHIASSFNLVQGEVVELVRVALNGKLKHRRSINSKYGTSTIEWLREHVDPKAEVINGKTKIKYVYPLNRRYFKTVQKMAKPYPKKI